MKNKMLGFFALILVGIILWSGLKTEYRFTKYQPAGCGRKATLVEYSAFLDRGAFFVAGDYDKCQIPSQEVIKLPKISGFDAYFECIITCKHEVVVINFNGWMPKSFSGSKTIIARVLDNESYQNLRKYAGNDLIKIH